LERVDVVCNPMLDEQFGLENDLFNQFSGAEEFKNPKLDELQSKYISQLSESKNIQRGVNSNPISAWHGFAEEHLDSISWYGLLSLSTTDPGYYGKGIYLTQLPLYGEYYANNLKFADSKSTLLLCWVLLGRPEAATKVHMDDTMPQSCTSRYVMVKKKALTREICETDSDFEHLDGVYTYLPITENESAEGDEIVVFKTEQVLPRYIVHYRNSKKDATQDVVQPSPQPNTSQQTNIKPSAPARSAFKKPSASAFKKPSASKS